MVQAQIIALLKSLVRERGLGLIIISHDLSLLGTECDRVDVMYAGRVVERGTARTVFDHAAHPYTAGLSAAFPTIGDAGRPATPRPGLPGDPPDPARRRSPAARSPRGARCAMTECATTEVELRDGVACLNPLAREVAS